jgi:hypothetical protein
VKSLRTGADTGAMSVARKSLVVSHESVSPWLSASFLAIGAYGVGALVGATGTVAQRAILTIGVCAVVTATEMVLHRSRGVEEDARRSHRARPASDELIPWVDNTLLTNRTNSSLPPYAAGMLRYTAAVVELLEHAVAVALDEGNDASEAAAGRDDAAALHHLLTGMAAEPVQLRTAAKVHTICSIWEAAQADYERAAAELDPEFHRRWRARHIATLRLRHGERPRRQEQLLPYREATTST